MEGLCATQVHVQPKYLTKFNDAECLLEFEEGPQMVGAKGSLKQMENWLGMPVQVCFTTPRPEQLKILHCRNNYCNSALTAVETQKEMRSKIQWASQHVLEQLILLLKREVREQTEEENHTTSFVSGTNNVRTDSFFPSTHSFSRYDLWNPPKISTFHDKEAPWKNWVFLEQWLFEFMSVQGLYLEPILRETVIKSLKRNVADLVRCMGPKFEAEEIILKLETVYWIVLSCHVLMQSFYKISQIWSEKIPAYTTRIEGTLNQNRLKYPDRLMRAPMEGHLREQLFHGMKKGIRY